MSRVSGVGDVYVWSRGIGSGRIICGCVLAKQIGLVCVVQLHLASGYWAVCCLVAAARSAVALISAESQVLVGSSCQSAASLGCGVCLCVTYVVNDSSSM